MAELKTSPEVCGMGHSMKRKEDPRFIRGRGNYVDDVVLPGMLHLAILRSPYAHARIAGIDVTAAQAHPKVKAVVTGADLAEVISGGTAVKHRGGELHRAPNGRPFTSDLSGQDFATLLRAGYRPVGLVMGNCVYHVARQGFRSFLGNLMRNQELVQYTQALYDSRELAMERMQQEAEALGARGIVGANIHEHTHTWGSHVIEFFAVGTAVDELSKDHIIEPPTLVLPLAD